MRIRWSALLWPISGIAIGFAVAAYNDNQPAEAGPSWDVPGKRWVTESQDGLMFWRHVRDGMQVTEFYVGEYVVPTTDKDAPPKVKLGVFQRSFHSVPAKSEPLRRYGEVLRQQEAPLAPFAPPPAPESDPSCGASCGGGSCG